MAWELVTLKAGLAVLGEGGASQLDPNAVRLFFSFGVNVTTLRSTGSQACVYPHSKSSSN